MIWIPESLTKWWDLALDSSGSGRGAIRCDVSGAAGDDARAVRQSGVASGSRSPGVSVVITTYDRAERLRQALESVAAQTYRDFEVIVVDDGSTDHTRQIAESFSGRVPSLRYVRQVNGGQSKALNTGIRMARGEYLAFLDDDDVWVPQKLARQVPMLEIDPGIGLVYSAVVCTRNGAPLRRQPEQPGWTLREMVERICFVHGSSVVARRECFDHAGMFDETMPRVKDFDMWLRIARHYRLGFVDEALAEYVQHDDQLTRQDFLGGAIGHLRAIQHVRPLPAVGVTWWLLRRRRAELHYVVARMALDEAKHGLAAKHFALAVWEWPTIGARMRKPGTSALVRSLSAVKPFGGVVVELVRAAAQRLSSHVE